MRLAYNFDTTVRSSRWKGLNKRQAMKLPWVLIEKETGWLLGRAPGPELWELDVALEAVRCEGPLPAVLLQVLLAGGAVEGGEAEDVVLRDLCGMQGPWSLARTISRSR